MTALLPGEARPEGSARRSSWLVGLALAVVTDSPEGSDGSGAVAELRDAAGDDVRVLEGAYGRALAVRSEFPDDTQVGAAAELLARALSAAQRSGIR